MWRCRTLRGDLGFLVPQAAFDPMKPRDRGSWRTAIPEDHALARGKDQATAAVYTPRDARACATSSARVPIQSPPVASAIFMQASNAHAPAGRP
jgi:hypothetical protein